MKSFIGRRASLRAAFRKLSCEKSSHSHQRRCDRKEDGRMPLKALDSPLRPRKTRLKFRELSLLRDKLLFKAENFALMLPETDAMNPHPIEGALSPIVAKIQFAGPLFECAQ